VIGRSVRRHEDERFLTGRGRYLADLPSSATLHAAIVRSSSPAARIVALETRAARAAEGVVAVLTGDDLAERLGPLPQLTTPHPRFAAAFSVQADPPRVPCIARDQVRWVGEPVAVVVAIDRYLAEDAAELVDVTYDPLEPVRDIGEATAPEARRVHDSVDGNVVFSLSYGKGRIVTPDDDHVVVERRLRIGRHSGVPLECRGVFAEPTSDGGVDVRCSTQVPFLVHRALCEATGWAPERVRVRAPDVGGGFGPKANVYGEDLLIPVIADQLGRPVVWVEDRYEHLTSAAQSRDQVHRTRLVVDRDGTIISWEDDFVVDIGAHNLWMSGVVANTAIHLLGAYRIPACRISGRAVLTNKTPTSQYRGAGRPEATFALERSLDAAAAALGISRLKLRELNILTGDDLPHEQGVPYRDGVDIVYDGRDYAAVLRRVHELIPEDQIRQLQEREAEEGRLVGVGSATFMEATGRGPSEYAHIRLADDGTIDVSVATADAGMSHQTTLAQVAASVLDRPLADVRVHTGDTASVPDGRGTFASRTAVVTGSAVHLAAVRFLDRARVLVAEALGVTPEELVHDHEGFATDGGERVRWQELAVTCGLGGELGDGGVLESLESFAPETVTWTMGAHLAVTGVDPATGVVKVLRYAAADESGSLINPGVVEGQVKGGIAQGIGGALLEEFRYDLSGQPTSTTFADYLLPGTGEVPRLDIAHIEAPSTRNQLGLKGVGESGTIPVCAAIASAVEDALRAYDVEVDGTPIRPADVRRWLRSAGR
jgi:aerobic carbon-monoxide dehydrogenase large subunit